MQWLIYARDLLATKRASRERATRTRAPVTVGPTHAVCILLKTTNIVRVGLGYIMTFVQRTKYEKCGEDTRPKMKLMLSGRGPRPILIIVLTILGPNL